MAFFYDAGKVASRREDLNFSGLKQDVGVGVRFHGPTATPLRIDVAKGDEGVNIVFSGAAAF
jgi:outer membrane translocation and assembly module TamA